METRLYFSRLPVHKRAGHSQALFDSWPSKSHYVRATLVPFNIAQYKSFNEQYNTLTYIKCISLQIVQCSGYLSIKDLQMVDVIP